MNVEEEAIECMQCIHMAHARHYIMVFRSCHYGSATDHWNP